MVSLGQKQSINEWFANSSVCHNHPDDWLKHRFLGHPRDWIMSGVSPRTCISSKWCWCWCSAKDYTWAPLVWVSGSQPWLHTRSAGKLLKTPMRRSLRPIIREVLGVGPRHRYFLKLPRQVMCSQGWEPLSS